MKFISKSILETYALAEQVAKKLSGGEIITLEGDLGVENHLYQRACKGFGSQRRDTFPTFIMMRQYKGRLKIYHYDLYRIEDEEELEELGIKENLYDTGAVSVIEWNKFKDLPKSP